MPSLRSWGELGPSNFETPRLLLLGGAEDVDVPEEHRVSVNLNQLWFEDTATLETARNQREIDDEIARLRAGDPTTSGTLRTAVTAAEARRNAAEQGLVAVVQSELNARATEMVAELKRDAEAAEFGSASVAFFKAMDAQQRSAGSASTGNATGNGASTGGAAAGTTGMPRTQP